MLFRVIFASILVAITSFALGFAWWTVVPFRSSVVQPAPEALLPALSVALPKSGVYMYPLQDVVKPDQDAIQAAMKEMEEKQAKGPIAEIIFSREGQAMGPVQLGIGFAHRFGCALLAAILLAMASLEGYGARVMFVFLLGVFASLTIQVSDGIWLHHPWDFIGFNAAYVVLNWLIAGILMGVIIKPPADAYVNR
jgi:hypothetical protein